MSAGFALVGDRRVVTSKGKTRLTGTLVTAAGGTDFVAWEPDRVVVGEPREVATGDMVAWKGELGEYNGRPQITLDRIRHARPSDGVLIGDLLPEGPGAPDDGGWDKALAEFTGSLVGNGALAAWEWATRLPRFASHPAGKAVHHAFVGGLRMHVWRMCSAAVDLVWGAYNNRSNLDARGSGFSPTVVLLGILYHDLGKLAELGSVPGVEWTPSGHLEGHIAISYRLWHRACDECGVDDDLRAGVAHVILSHHGSKDLGSPVTPRTPEAILVAALDKLDANLQSLWEGIGEDGQGDVWALGGRVYVEAPGVDAVVLAMSDPELPSAKGVEPEGAAL